MQLISQKRSILQGKLDHLALQIGYVGLIAGALCFVILALHFSIKV